MYEMNTQVSFTQCDEKGSLKLHETVRLMMDCAQFQEYQERAFREYLQKNHLAIYLFSIQIDFLKKISFRERIKSCVKIYGCKSIYGLRRFTIRNERDELCMIANATGAFFDLKAGKAVKQDPEGFPLKFDRPEEMECLPRKVGVPEQKALPCDPVKVGSSMLDPNGHLTSSAYFAMAGDALEETFTYTRTRMEYKHQAKRGETILPYRYTEGDRCVIDLRNEENSFSYALCEFTSPATLNV